MMGITGVIKWLIGVISILTDHPPPPQVKPKGISSPCNSTVGVVIPKCLLGESIKLSK